MARVVTDLADRKIVAAALAAKADRHSCKLVNACDTDWLDYAAILDEFGIEAEHIIEGWLRKKMGSEATTLTGDFFRFPHTPHLAGGGRGARRATTRFLWVLAEARELLTDETW